MFADPQPMWSYTQAKPVMLCVAETSRGDRTALVKFNDTQQPEIWLLIDGEFELAQGRVFRLKEQQ